MRNEREMNAIPESSNVLKSIKLEKKYGIPKAVDLVGITNKDLIIICLKGSQKEEKQSIRE